MFFSWAGDRVAAVFWAQQAAEKALKAVLLAFRGVVSAYS